MKTIIQFSKIEFYNERGRKCITNVPHSVLRILQERKAQLTILENFSIADFWDAEYIDDKEYSARNVKIKKGLIYNTSYFGYSDNMMLTKKQMNNRNQAMNAWANKMYYELDCPNMPRGSSFATMLKNKNII